MSVIQIPFSAFKAIEVLKNVTLSLYQSLYDDRTEPVGIAAVTQVLGHLKPSNAAIDIFNKKWNSSRAKWSLRGTGIEFVAGKGVTTDLMMKTLDGEITLVVLSFLFDSLTLDSTDEFIKKIIDMTPPELVPVKPRRSQITSLLEAVQSQVSGVSWHDQVKIAEAAVWEPMSETARVSWPNPSWSFDIPMQAMAQYYQALCTISRFPDDYHCGLETGGSLVICFVLAQVICGLRVLVIIDGVITHDSCLGMRWQVLLRRKSHEKETKIKLGRKVGDIQDLLIVSDLQPRRANKIPIRGIGQASTTGQGLSQPEAEEIAISAICIVTRALMRMKRETKKYNGLDEESDISFGSLNGPSAAQPHLVPVQTQVSAVALSLWWDCSTIQASKMLEQTEDNPLLCQDDKSWEDITWGKLLIARIARFEALSNENQSIHLLKNKGPCSRNDFTRLLQSLAAQILLLSFLDVDDSSQLLLRVRIESKPHFSILGRALRGTMVPLTLGQSDIIASWHYWLTGYLHPDLDLLEVVVGDGFLIYRSLLLNLSLEPAACEKVVIHPGYVLFDGGRYERVTGPDTLNILGNARYQNVISGPSDIISCDKSGSVSPTWRVMESHEVLQLELRINVGNSSTIDTSVYSVVLASWELSYAGRSLKCRHGTDSPCSLIQGQSVEEFTPGKSQENTAIRSQYRPLKLYRAHKNDLGQVASLMSSRRKGGNNHGMVKTESCCLQCCLTEAQGNSFEFVVD